MSSPDRPGFMPSHGRAEVVYDLTFNFCGRFLKEGGLRERMTRARLNYRKRMNKPHRAYGTISNQVSRRSLF
jgi:hypothetical protein